MIHKIADWRSNRTAQAIKARAKRMLKVCESCWIWWAFIGKCLPRAALDVAMATTKSSRHCALQRASFCWARASSCARAASGNATVRPRFARRGRGEILWLKPTREVHRARIEPGRRLANSTKRGPLWRQRKRCVLGRNEQPFDHRERSLLRLHGPDLKG